MRVVVRATAALVVLLLCAAGAHANDGRQDWRTLETEHFFVHYYRLADDEGVEPVAQRIAVVAEEAHRRLVPQLGPGLSQRKVFKKTHIYITDQVDDFNGFATVVPYPNIQLYANSPNDRAELNDYDDWLLDLVTHEYTHILHLGTMKGWCAPLINAVFGLGFNTVYSPNQAQPRWLIEGLAVVEETHRTSGGRLRNSIWNMYLRTQVLEGRMQRLDQFTNDPIQFPYGNSAYLYGSTFLQYLTTRYGDGVIKKLSDDYAGRCIPGAINRSVRKVTGRTWPQHYADFRGELVRRYTAEREALGPLTETTVLLSARPEVDRPSYLRDGEIIVVHESDGHRRERFVYVDSQQRVAPRTLVDTDASGGPWPSSDDDEYVYFMTGPYRTYYGFNDLYLYNRRTQVTRRLTEGVRAENPTRSPDGRWVVFEYTKNGSRGLGRIDLHALGTRPATREDVEELVSPRGLEHAYTPAFSPDGAQLAFSWWRRGGQRDIWIYDVQQKSLRQITDDRALDLEPRFSPDGKTLYFVSDRTGIYNLYAYDLGSSELWQATNVVHGVFDPAISPDGRRVAFVGFAADGYTLEEAELDRAKWTRAAPAPGRPALAPPAETPPLPSRPYRPWSTLFRFSFSPATYLDPWGQVIALTFSGSDIIGRHYWDATLGIGTGRKDDVSASFNYAYYRFWPDLHFGASRSLSRRGGLVINGTERGYDEEAWSTGASLGLPVWRRTIEAVTMYLSYSLSYTRSLTARPAPNPNELTPRYPETGRYAGFALGIGYSNLRRFLYSVSTESGRYLNLSFAVSHRALGAQYDIYSAQWSYGEFIPLPWPHRLFRNHVLALQYSGGIAGGDLVHRGLYYLGGYPTQDLLRSIFDFSRPGTATLRGYPFASQFGNQFHVANIEYRFPIAWIERGLDTFPLYLRRVHGKVFADYGGAFFGGVGLDKFKLGIGAEVMLELTYLYYFSGALQLGYAHGFGAGGKNQVYFYLNNPF